MCLILYFAFFNIIRRTLTWNVFSTSIITDIVSVVESSSVSLLPLYYLLLSFIDSS